jgi:DNA-binding MarR family transcriptional regulator
MGRDQGQDMRDLLRAVRRVARAFDIQSRRMDRAVGLTLPQFIVLSCVADMGEVTSRAISAEAGLSPPTVVGVLDKLEAKGMIERYRSTRDRRIVHARLTEGGAAALRCAPEPLGAAFAEAFAALPPPARSEILAALGALGGMLEATNALAEPPEGEAALPTG